MEQLIPVRLTELLRNPIVRTVGILDLVSLSILELLDGQFGAKRD